MLSAAEAVAVGICIVNRVRGAAVAHPDECRFCDQPKSELLDQLKEWHAAGEPGRAAFEKLPRAEQVEQRLAAQRPPETPWYDTL